MFYVFGICLRIASLLKVVYAPNVEGGLNASFLNFFSTYPRCNFCSEPAMKKLRCGHKLCKYCIWKDGACHLCDQFVFRLFIINIIKNMRLLRWTNICCWNAMWTFFMCWRWEVGKNVFNFFKFYLRKIGKIRCPKCGDSTLEACANCKNFIYEGQYTIKLSCGHFLHWKCQGSPQ